MINELKREEDFEKIKEIILSKDKYTMMVFQTWFYHKNIIKNFEMDIDETIYFLYKIVDILLELSPEDKKFIINKMAREIFNEEEINDIIISKDELALFDYPDTQNDFRLSVVRDVLYPEEFLDKKNTYSENNYMIIIYKPNIDRKLMGEIETIGNGDMMYITIVWNMKKIIKNVLKESNLNDREKRKIMDNLAKAFVK